MSCDCISIGTEKPCKVLNVRKCLYPNCGFMKTAERMAGEKLKISQRLYSLPYYQQMHIADTYYNGRMWWIPYLFSGRRAQGRYPELA